MNSLLVLLILLITFVTAALLAHRFIYPAKRGIIAMGVLVFWLCALIMPMQWAAFLNLIRLSSHIGLAQVVFWDVVSLCCALWLWLPRPTLTREQLRMHGSAPSRPPRHVMLGLLIVVGVYVILASKLVLTFPGGWDALVYRYPVALRWFQERTLRITSATNWRASLPGNVELLDLLVLSSGRQRLLGVVQWPGVLILLMACLHLTRRLDRSALSAWPVVTTVLMIPMVANQSMSGYVDLFGTAVLLGSLAFVLEYRDQVAEAGGKGPAPRPAFLAAAGLGCGLAAGAKPVFWLYAGILILVTSAMLLRGGRGAGRQIVLFAAACALPSIFWFVRATMCTGNPLYPFAVRVGSFSLPGVRPADITDPNYYLSYVRHWAEWFVYPWTEWKSATDSLGTSYTTGDGLGAAFATFVVPGVIFSGYLAKRGHRELRAWLLGLLVLGISWWFLLQKVSRFGLPLFVLAVIVSAPIFQLLEARATRLYAALYVAVFTATALILVLEPLDGLFASVRHRFRDRAAYYGYPAVIDSLKPGSRILNTSDGTLNFPLAGRDLTNRVIPNWEKPSLLTAGFLRSTRVDYVVEKLISPDSRTVTDTPPPVEGLELYFHATVIGEDGVVRWRIWSATRLRGG